MEETGVVDRASPFPRAPRRVRRAPLTSGRGNRGTARGTSIATGTGNSPVLRAALAHLWFVTIHPFADGNGRIACAIADWQLARSDRSAQGFYSMSAQIRLERSDYYALLE